MNYSFSPVGRVPLVLIVLGLTTGGAMKVGGQTPTATPAVSTAASVNLVTNGDFQLATDPTWPDSWGKGAGITYETEDGKHFLRLTQTEAGKMLSVYREIPLPAGVKKLAITIRFRSSNVVAGREKFMDARTVFHFLDSNHKAVKPEPKPIDMTKGAAAWTMKTETCDVPDGATKLVIMPALFQAMSGTLDLAEISVSPAP